MLHSKIVQNCPWASPLYFNDFSTNAFPTEIRAYILFQFSLLELNEKNQTIFTRLSEQNVRGWWDKKVNEALQSILQYTKSSETECFVCFASHIELSFLDSLSTDDADRSQEDNGLSWSAGKLARTAARRGVPFLPAHSCAANSQFGKTEVLSSELMKLSKYNSRIIKARENVSLWQRSRFL